MKRPCLRRCAFALALIVLALPGVGNAQWESSRARALMNVCPNGARLRAELARVADSLLAADPHAAAEARYWRGMSETRAALADSAIADLELAVRLRGSSDESLALADALLERRRGADVESATTMMWHGAPSAEATEEQVPFRSRFGWGLFLGGRADSALAVMRPLLRALGDDLLWRKRIGLIAAGAHDPTLAVGWLLPAAVETRGFDPEIRQALRAALSQKESTRSMDLDALLRERIAQKEAAERFWVDALGGRIVRMRASDGFPVSGALFADAERRPLAAVLMASGDTLASYDSLVVTLRRSGLAVLLIERRGAGGSIGAGCAMPAETYGHEDAFEQRIARDAFELMRSAAREGTGADTTRCLMTGVKDAAATAVLAATLDQRTRALLLISVDPPLTDVGAVRTWLAKLQLPAYIQMAPEDWTLVYTADALYQSGNRGSSRVAESRSAGRGAALFRGDPNVAARFALWIKDALGAPGHRSTPPPARRRE